MKKPALICLGLLLPLATSVSAGPPPGRGDGGLGRSPRVAPLFMRSLVQPDTIMRNQARLELSEEQRETIQKALGETRSSMEESRWELAGHKESIRRVLDQSPIDADKALEATAELFRLETAIKTQHLKMLIEITNVLTPRQLKKAQRLQKRGFRKRKDSAERSSGPVRPDRFNG